MIHTSEFVTLCIATAALTRLPLADAVADGKRD
jgi:hypothetical protein